MQKVNWTDEQMLKAMHLIEADGFSNREVGDALGRPANSVIGMRNRVNNDTDKHDLSPHLNGTEKPMWWKAGISKQKRLGAHPK